MLKVKSKIEKLQEQVEQTIGQTNKKIVELGENTVVLFEKLNEIEALFDAIRNVPHEQKIKYESLKPLRLKYKHQAEVIENDYKNAMAKNAGKGMAGIGVGAAAAAMGPSVAMGIATTFGVASTGTAISSLSGAAATNAAMAWLGGGAIAAGGGGMAAGHILLARFVPIGWTIAGISLLGSGAILFKGHLDKNKVQDIWTLIYKRDIKLYDLALVELNERIEKIKNGYQGLEKAIKRVKSFGNNYLLMTEEQQYELGDYVNRMNTATQLLINPILGLIPKYSDKKLEKFIKYHPKYQRLLKKPTRRNLVISLICLLYDIEMDPQERKLFWRSLRGNAEFLHAQDVSQREFSFTVMEAVDEALRFEYRGH